MKSPTTTQNPIWVSIVEDNRFVREGWTATLRADSGIRIIGAFESCEEAFAHDAFTDSEVVLMDIGLPGISGIEGVLKLKEANSDAAVIICTVYEDDQKIFDALCNGATGYLLKEVSPPELVKAIKDAAAGGSPMSPNIARKVIATFQKPPAVHQSPQHTLTDREREVLILLAEGKSYATIAQQLFLSVDGVVSRIRKIYEKLQAHSRGEAVAKGLAQGIISPPAKI
ncbi:MAG: response regulator transcription factor [Bacteroidetes bacterium]|nr:response regulator transcription factor [Bacteroidota bacterium]MCW5894413.1 response regulator transcription factor [Bacteroidota bacterium]